MTYKEALAKARSARTFEEADAICRAAEDEYITISDRQYYQIKYIALKSACEALSKQDAPHLEPNAE